MAKGHTYHTSRKIDTARNEWNTNATYCIDCGMKKTPTEYGIWCKSCHAQTRVRNNVALSRKARGVKNWYAPVVERPYKALG